MRLPRIEAAVALLRHEQEWLPRLAQELPVPVPAPVRLGEPDAGYPWPWSIVPWVPGRSADIDPLAAAEAAGFGRFLAAVHRPAPEGFPRNDYRGVPLASVAERFERLLHRVSTSDIADTLPLTAMRQRWQRATAAPIDVPETRVHGDLHPRNLVVDGGRLASVLDWGDMTTGDRAVDLGAAWMLFPVETHAEIWAAYGPVSPATLDRAAGWALLLGLSLVDAGLAGDRVFAEIGRITLLRACAQ